MSYEPKKINTIQSHKQTKEIPFENAKINFKYHGKRPTNDLPKLTQSLLLLLLSFYSHE